jgi:hypothetical protein
MFMTPTTRSIALAFAVTSAIASVNAVAEQDQQGGKRRGPPPEAIEACADLSEGAACSFTGRRGDASGICFAPPRDDAELACAPEGGPPAHHRQDEESDS